MHANRKIRPLYFKKLHNQVTVSVPVLNFASSQLTLDRWGTVNQTSTTLSVSNVPSSAVTVSLTSSDPSVTISPTSVSFGPSSAMSASVTFTGTTLGPNQVVITATPSDAGIAATTLTITRPAYGLPVTNGLSLWVRADQGVFKNDGTAATADLDSVKTWKDYSGLARDLSQATTGTQPVLKLAAQNNLPGLQFDGVDDMLEFATTMGLTDLSIYWVGRFLELPSNESAFFHGVNSNYAANNYSSGLYWFQGADIVTGANGSFNQNTPYRTTISRAGSAWQLTVNDADKLVGGNATTATIKGVGRAYFGYSSMIVHEMIIYSRKLSTAENTDVNTYLSRWGI